MDKNEIRHMTKDALIDEFSYLLEKYEALTESAKVILMQNEFEKSAEEIFHLCKRVTGASSGYVALLSADGSENEVLFLDSGGLECTVDESLPMPIRGLRATAYHSLKGTYDNNFSESDWMKFLPEGHMRLENVMFAPLIIDQKAVGLIGLANKKGGFEQRDVDFVASLGDIAAMALRNSRNLEQIQYLSFHDQLTGLYNRHYIRNEVERLQNSRDYPIAIISADIDGLKEANDNFGHSYGDRMLQACASVLRDSLRSYDYLARIGGDEFILILPKTNREDGDRIMSRISQRIREHNGKKESVSFSLSMGLAICESKSDSLREAYKRADHYMYKEKAEKKRGPAHGI